MVILRDEKRIERLSTIGKVTSFLGMAALIAGMIILFISQDPRTIYFQMTALLVGWILSQVGIYLSHRYLRSPRPDEVLDNATRKAERDGRFYHYLLPAPHVLLTTRGIIVMVPKFQGGKISVDENGKWRQKGLGLRKFFSQEGIGNPVKEAETMVNNIASYLNKHAPSIDEVPIGAMIVFTTKNGAELDLKNSTIPAMHYTKVKGFLRQQKSKDILPRDDYNTIRAAFDEKAAHLIA